MTPIHAVLSPHCELVVYSARARHGGPGRVGFVTKEVRVITNGVSTETYWAWPVSTLVLPPSPLRRVG
jgi:hypothetical protein